MPLPNTDGQKFSPGESYTPNTAAMAQMGANVNQIKKLQDQNQAISKVLDTISSRLGNVTNMRTNVQSATFEAFGNNFLTRGMNQIAETIGDSISSLFSKDEEKTEDPVVKAIKEQTVVSNEILKQSNLQLTNGKQLVSLLTDQSKSSHLLLELAKHPRANEQLAKDGEKQRTILYKQENTLKEILTALTDRNSGTDGFKPTEKVSDDTVTIEADTGEIQTPEEAEKIKASKRRMRTKKGGRKFGPVSQEAAEKLLTPEADGKSKFQKRYAAGNDSFAIFGVIGKDIKDSKTLLTGILETQKECCSNLDKMAKQATGEQFTPEKIAAETPEAAVATPDVKGGFWQGARDFFRRPSKDKANIAAATGGKDVFSKVASTVEEKAGEAMEAPPEAGGPNVDLSLDLPERAGKMKSAAKAGKMLKFAKAAALTTAAVGAAGYVTDAAFGAFGVGKDAQGNDLQVDTKQDDANWNKMSFGEKLQSGAARGVEKVGSFMFLDNLSKQAQADRIKNETQYLAGREAGGNVDAINDSQKALAAQATGIPAASAANINNTTMVNNQTVMPSRAIVKNSDDSYNRYILTILK